MSPRARDPDDDDRHDLDDHMAQGGYDEDDDDFDYDEFVANEFPDHSERRASSSSKPWIWITAWVLILAMLLPFLLSLWAAR